MRRNGKIRLIFWGAIFGFLVLMLFPLKGLAEGKNEEDKNLELEWIVVTPTRVEKPLSELSTNVSLIDEEKLKEFRYNTLDEVQLEVPGILSSRAGGSGGQNSIYIRGAKTEQVLVMVDGVELNEAMGLGRAASLELITLEGVERVELLKSPASALYGSDALGGVINIITKPAEQGSGANFSLEGGSFGTHRELLESFFGREKYRFRFSLANFSTDGISSAKDGSERDGFSTQSATFRTDLIPSDYIKMNIMVKGIMGHTEMDSFNDFTGLPEDDENYKMDTTKLIGNFSVDSYSFSSRWHQNFKFGYAEHLREVKDDEDELHPEVWQDSDYNSSFRLLSYQSDVELNDKNKLSVGIEYQEESGSFKSKGGSSFGPYEDEFKERTLIRRSAFALWDLHSKDYGFVAGARADNSDQFGEHLTGSVSGFLRIGEVGPKLRVATSTGFKAPSLYQLYGEAFGFMVGNPDLKPEESWSREAGVEQSLFEEKIKMNVDYFETNYKNLIEWDSVKFGYNNIARASSKGWEAELKFRPIDSLEFNLGYTFIDARDEETQEKLIRRAGTKYSASLFYNFQDKFRTYITSSWVGERDDEIFVMGEKQRVKLDPYNLVDLGIEYKIWDGMKVYLRAENILNEDYEEVYGYNSIPQSFYAGIDYALGTSKGKGL